MQVCKDSGGDGKHPSHEKTKKRIQYVCAVYHSQDKGRGANTANKKKEKIEFYSWMRKKAKRKQLLWLTLR